MADWLDLMTLQSEVVIEAVCNCKRTRAATSDRILFPHSRLPVPDDLNIDHKTGVGLT